MWSDYIPILLNVISQTAMPAAWKGKTMHHVQQSGIVFFIMRADIIIPTALSRQTV